MSVTGNALPAPYVWERVGATIVVGVPASLPVARAAIAAAGSLYAHAARETREGPLRGRGATYRLETAAGEWVVRRYLRGGVPARVSADAYLRVGTPRPLRELRASVAARQRGVATPEIAVLAIYPAGAIYRADVATRFIAGAVDLAALSLGAGRWGEADCVAAWRDAGTLMRRAFAAGVDHADLNLRNILIQRDAAAGVQVGSGGIMRCWLLDLDRCSVGAPVGRGRRRAILARFDRSRRKLESAAGGRVDTAAVSAFREQAGG